MAQIPLYDPETGDLVNEAALREQEDERLRQRPRKSFTEMRLAGGLAGGEFMRDYTSTPEYRQRAIRKTLSGPELLVSKIWLPRKRVLVSKRLLKRQRKKPVR